VSRPNLYVWGEAVDLDAVQQGYIRQLRDHTITIRTQTPGKFKWDSRGATVPCSFGQNIQPTL